MSESPRRLPLLDERAPRWPRPVEGRAPLGSGPTVAIFGHGASSMADALIDALTEAGVRHAHARWILADEGEGLGIERGGAGVVTIRASEADAPRALEELGGLAPELGVLIVSGAAFAAFSAPTLTLAILGPAPPIDPAFRALVAEAELVLEDPRLSLAPALAARLGALVA